MYLEVLGIYRSRGDGSNVGVPSSRLRCERVDRYVLRAPHRPRPPLALSQTTTATPDPTVDNILAQRRLVTSGTGGTLTGSMALNILRSPPSRNYPLLSYGSF